MLKATESPEVISFAGGLPAPELFPVEEFAQACQEVLAEDRGAALQYSTTEGYPPLRQWVCDHLWQTIKLRCTPEQMLITTGSQQALDLIAKVLIDPGDTVLVENPAYLGALQAFDAYEANLVGVACDENGIIPDELRATLAKCSTPPKFLYVIPNFQNPTGVSLSVERRAQVAQIAAEFGVPIFEDDCYADLIWEGKRPPAIHAMAQNGGVIHIGSFSKSIAPALRVGFIVAPWEMLSRMLALKTDAGSGALEQMVLAEYCAPHFATHVPKLTKGLRRKLDTLMDALSEQFGTSAEFEDPKGGIFLWVKLPDNVDTLKLYQAALAAGVAINPGPEWSTNKGHAGCRLRLCFASPSEQQIREGVAVLADVCRKEFGVPVRIANVEKRA